MSLPWFCSWLRTHLARHCTLGLPKHADNIEMYEAWEEELERQGITERAANLASIRLMSRAKPLRFHFEFLVQTAKGLAEKPKEPERKGAAPEYVPPPPPRGAELDEFIATAMGPTPLARNMRLELRHYILAGEVDVRSIPPELLDRIADEPEETKSVTPPKLRSAHAYDVLAVR